MAATSVQTTLSVPLLSEKNRVDEEELIASDAPNENEVSFIRTCLHGLNAIAGVAFYSGLLMKRCMEINSNIKTYPDIGELGFENTGRLIVSISMYTEVYLLSIGFLILEGGNLSNLFPIEEFHVAGISIDAKQFFVILVALIILPTVWLDNLKLLSYVSASGVFASDIIMLSIAWTAAFDEVGVHQKG